MTTYRNATITLICNSAVAKPPTLHTEQTVQIIQRDTLASKSSDLDRTERRPCAVRWHGGDATDLTGITDVRIEEEGVVVMEGSIMPTFGPPWNIPEGVQFLIM